MDFGWYPSSKYRNHIRSERQRHNFKDTIWWVISTGFETILQSHTEASKEQNSPRWFRAKTDLTWHEMLLAPVRPVLEPINKHAGRGCCRCVCRCRHCRPHNVKLPLAGWSHTVSQTCQSECSLWSHSSNTRLQFHNTAGSEGEAEAQSFQSR